MVKLMYMYISISFLSNQALHDYEEPIITVHMYMYAHF